MIRIAICDDARDFSLNIKKLIYQWADQPEPIICEIFDNGDSLIAAHIKNPFDIILLDIMMPILNGLDTAREIREFDKISKIIFFNLLSRIAIEQQTKEIGAIKNSNLQPRILRHDMRHLLDNLAVSIENENLFIL